MLSDKQIDRYPSFSKSISSSKSGAYAGNPVFLEIYAERLTLFRDW
jgi:hypothetical protein